jgi:hypothetical protein
MKMCRELERKRAIDMQTRERRRSRREREGRRE